MQYIKIDLDKILQLANITGSLATAARACGTNQRKVYRVLEENGLKLEISKTYKLVKIDENRKINDTDN